MPDIRLAGCRPEPLLSYLKALGVLRLVAGQKDPQACGAWRQEAFVLQSSLDEAGLLEFFLKDYQPTPIVAPWAGGCGFFEKDNTKALDIIVVSKTPRLSAYRTVIKQVRAILKVEKLTKKPTEEKEHLLRLYRRSLPDEFLEWMDCAIVLQAEGQRFPPLLGTGGNDGRLDFTQNFMQRLVALGFADIAMCAPAETWLRSALWGEVAAGLPNTAIGQFDPGHAGGPNATQGFEGDSLVNPWDFVLMLEGALLLAGSVTRRLGVGLRDKAAFPFTVNASTAGQGALASKDAGEARGEIWLPLWSNFTRFTELRLMFAEGRAQLGSRQARDAVDFARAIAGLGVDRGLTSFTRYAFLKRSGKSYLATSLGRFDARPQSTQVHLLAELDDWLLRYKSACNGKNVPARFGTAVRRLEAAIFEYCRYGDPARFGAVVCALGQCEREMSMLLDKPGQIGKSEGQRPVPPVPLLSSAWLVEAQEDSPEFRLALGLASIRGAKKVGALRTNLEPVGFKGQWWDWDGSNHAVVWSDTSLCNNLYAVLNRRLLEAEREGLEQLPLAAAWPVRADDAASFIGGQTDHTRLEEWLWGLVLIDLEKATGCYHPAGTAQVAVTPLPRAYALLKLLFLTGKGALRDTNNRLLKPEPAVLSRLHADDLTGACQLAARRLRATGFVALPGPTSGGSERPLDYWLPKQAQSLLTAALLFPLSNSERIKAMVLRPARLT